MYRQIRVRVNVGNVVESRERGNKMNDLLVALMLTQMEAKKGLEELLSELTHRVLDLEKRVKKLEENE